MSSIIRRKRKIKGFPLDSFIDRYKRNDSSIAQDPALRDLRKSIPLNSEVDDNFIFITESLEQAGFTKCRGYMDNIMIIDAIEKTIDQNLQFYAHLDGRDDLLERFLAVDIPLRDIPVSVRTFLFAMCLPTAPNTEKILQETPENHLLEYISHMMMLDYRRECYAVQKTQAPEDRYQKTIKIVRDAVGQRRPLKR